MTLLAAWGLVYIWRLRFWRYLVVGVYSLSVLNFSYQYFYRYPIISLDWGNFDERVLARYIVLHQEQHPEGQVRVYGPEPEYDFWSYLFYSRLLSDETKDKIGETMRGYTPFVSKEAEYTLDRVTFSSFCAPNDLELLALYDETELAVGTSDSASASQDLVIIRGGHKTCPVDAYNRQGQPDLAKRKLPVLSILAVLDSGERLRIYGDQLCFGMAGTFIHVQSLAQLDLEQQGAAEFCETWIKNLKLVK